MLFKKKDKIAEEKTGEVKEKKPKSKVRKTLEWVFTGIFLAICLVIGAGQIDGMIHSKEHFGQSIRFGLGNFLVETDSMEPRIPTGAAIITFNEAPEKIIERFEKGETVDITFMDITTSYDLPYHPDDFDDFHFDASRTSPTGVPMTHNMFQYAIDDTKPVGEGHYIFFVKGINTESKYKSAKGQWQNFTEKEILGRVVVTSPFLGGIFSFITSIWGLLILLLIPAIYLVITSVLDITKGLKDDDEVKENPDGTAVIEQKPNVDLNGISDKDRERLKQQMLQEMLEAKAKERAARLAEEAKQNEEKPAEVEQNAEKEGE